MSKDTNRSTNSLTRNTGFDALGLVKTFELTKRFEKMKHDISTLNKGKLSHKEGDFSLQTDSCTLKD
jgi:hypothetical protein